MSVSVAFPAIVVGIGSMMQGWDFAAMSGALPFLKVELKLEDNPSLEGIVVAMPLVGATLLTLFSGILSDWLGRRLVLIMSSIFFFFGGLFMLWSPNIYVLIVARLIDGFGIGLATNNVPIYVSETSPPEIRGLLSTIPQFMFSTGTVSAYVIVFMLNPAPHPNWRLMIGSIFIAALIYFILLVVYSPESPRWLVSQGRYQEARLNLQRLRGTEDVAGELALLVEGLNVAGKTTTADFMVSVTNELPDGQKTNESMIRLHATEAGGSVVAGQSFLESVVDRTSRPASFINDPVVAIFRSIHESYPENKSILSSSYPGSTGGNYSVPDDPWAETRERRDLSDADEVSSDDDLEASLLTKQAIADPSSPVRGDNDATSRNISVVQSSVAEPVRSVGIGSGWLLAWTPGKGEDGRLTNDVNRVYLHGDRVLGSRNQSVASLSRPSILSYGELPRAAALISKSALDIKEVMDLATLEPAVARVAEDTKKRSKWQDIWEPGVRRALSVGILLQIFQQFSGVPCFLKYNPTILGKAGIITRFSGIGINTKSIIILISGITSVCMLPCILLAMKLMDTVGRRGLLLLTLPITAVAFLVMIFSLKALSGTLASTVLFLIGLLVSFCAYSMGLGPITGMFCSEIFPTSVRAVCITICMMSYWLASVVSTYIIPIILQTVDVNGLLWISAIVCCIACTYFYFQMPETKGLPIEVIVEIFKLGEQKLPEPKNTP